MRSFIPDWVKNIPSTAYKEVPSDFVRLDLAINKHPPSPRVTEVLRTNISGINEYPETNWSILVKEISKYCGVNSDEILLTNGLEEAIDIITRLLVKQQEEVFILTPTYSQFHIAALRVRARTRKEKYIELEDYLIPMRRVERILNEQKIKLFWICNPNNPTGTLFEKEVLLPLIEKANCIVVIDECFYEYAKKSLSDLLDCYEKLLILRSFSKSFALAGIRIGYIVGSSRLIENLLKMRQPSSVNFLAQHAALAALQDLDYYEKTWKNDSEERDKLKKKLEGLNFKVFPSSTNFLLIKAKNAEELYTDLWKNKISVLHGEDPEFTGLGEEYIRITVGLPEENAILIETLQDIINRYKKG